MADPGTDDDLSFLDAVETIIKQAATVAKFDVSQLVEQWKEVGFLADKETWAANDHEDAQKLVRYSDVIDEVYRLRDEILNRELPGIVEGIFSSIERWWDRVKAGAKAWWILLNYGDPTALVEAYRQLALQTSPRSFIGRVNESRKRSEERLRTKSLFARSEKRFQRKVSHRL
jgi:hypothetical protein